jgi:hypothetical protein
MERPTIAADRRLARAIAAEFLARVDGGVVRERMQLMRDAMKRVLRLTPLVAFSALDSTEVAQLVAHTFDVARGSPERSVAAPSQPPSLEDAPDASPDVVHVETLALCVVRARSAVGEDDLELIVQATLDIARRTGRVTSTSLREVVPITAEEAEGVQKHSSSGVSSSDTVSDAAPTTFSRESTDPDAVPLLDPAAADRTPNDLRTPRCGGCMQRRST